MAWKNFLVVVYTLNLCENP